MTLTQPPPDNTSTPTTSVTVVGPGDVPITLQFINDNVWPKDFKLDIQLNNWDEWSFQVTLLAG